MLKIAEKWQSSWGGADSARKEETRNSGCILRLREWGCHVISHLGVPDQGAYGSRPQTHPPPTPGAPKDHPSFTKIARFRHPRGGGRIRRDKETWVFWHFGTRSKLIHLLTLLWWSMPTPSGESANFLWWIDLCGCSFSVKPSYKWKWLLRAENNGMNSFRSIRNFQVVQGSRRTDQG